MANYIYGVNSVTQILSGKREVKKLLIANSNQKIINLAKSRNITIENVKNSVLDKLARGERHQGCVLEVAPFNYSSMDEILHKEPKGKHRFIVILDGIEDPHNFGAIVRTAETAGVDAIIIGANRQVPVNSTVEKVSTGATDLVPIVKVTNINNAIKKLKDNGMWVVTSDMSGQNYTDIDFDMATCLIIGSEGKGVSPLVRKNSDIIATLPMYGEITSLNASVSAGILMYQIKTFLK